MQETFKLTTDEQQRLRTMDRDILRIRDTLNKLKLIGTIDVSEYEEKLESAERTRAGFLAHFGAPMGPRT